MKYPLLTLFKCMPLWLTMPVMADVWQAETGATQTVVLEKFTAEGCGNCPPANEWTDTLYQQGINSDDLIILGFHVDYLDQKKGWTDVFADPRFTQRQQQLARLNLSQSVYTPEVFISGEVIHNWREHGREMIDFINSFPPQAEIKLQAEQTGNQLQVTTAVAVKGEHNRQHSQLFLAVVEDNLPSKIEGGDNQGSSVIHQHVVRLWSGPHPLAKNGQTTITRRLSLDKQWKQADLRLVAVVQNLDDGYVLQGLALPLTD